MHERHWTSHDTTDTIEIYPALIICKHPCSTLTRLNSDYIIYHSTTTPPPILNCTTISQHQIRFLMWLTDHAMVLNWKVERNSDCFSCGRNGGQDHQQLHISLRYGHDNLAVHNPPTKALSLQMDLTTITRRILNNKLPRKPCYAML